MLYTFPFVLMRSPVLPLDLAYNFNEEISDILQEGIYLSSPELWKEIKKKDQLSLKEKKKLELSVAKYHIRSSIRCTPYGTFAGSAVVKLTDLPTKITLEDSRFHKRKIRIDMNYMTEIIHALITQPAIRDQILFFTNNSLYELPESFRYAQYYIKNNQRYYELTAVEKTDYLKSVLDMAANGTDIISLISYLVSTKDVSREEALDYVLSIYESQLIIAELEPCVTGKEPLDNLIEQLIALKETEKLQAKLKSIQKLIATKSVGVEIYQKIEEQLNKLEAKQVPKNTLQADLFLSTKHNNLNQQVIDKIIDNAKDLYIFSRTLKNKSIEDFKSKFLAKYDQQQMPLAFVLDNELGIGYATANHSSTGEGYLINDLILGTNEQILSFPFDAIQNYKTAKYHDYLEKNQSVIEITESEIAGLRKNTPPPAFPNSLYLVGSFYKNEIVNDISEEIFFEIEAFTGPSAGNLLARFTHGDKELYELTKNALEDEEAQYPDTIFAEIAHLPQARLGNVLLRPVLRNYEIPYIGRSGAKPNNQIPISDILVSVRNNQVYLHSKKYNKRIIPRITTAHNYIYQSLPIYRFLGDLQSQGLSQSASWDWGYMANYDHLPRVVYKNLILNKAQWKISESKIADLPKATDDYLEYFKKFIEKWKIPQRVLYVEADNKLLIDFNERIGIDLFLHYIRKHKTIKIEEFLFTNENCIVKDKAGNSYTNEFIIPLYAKNDIKTEGYSNLTSVNNNVKRKFSPDSEWLYFKIYCGHTVAEKILRNEIRVFIEEVLAQELLEKFFYIRYFDDAPHLRIRFYNRDKEKQANLHRIFFKRLQPLIDNNFIEKITLDTYVREIERYGENLIVDSETIFFSDSLATIRFIDLLGGPDSEKYRMLFALRGIDMLLSDFEFLTGDKKELAKLMQKVYFKEFQGQNMLEKQLNDKYRKEQKDIFSHMNPENDELNEIKEAVGIFKVRSEMNKSSAENILNKLAGDKNRKFDLLRSYIHMFMNRLFVNNQRKYELVVYHYLERYYTSKFALEKKAIIFENQL